MLECTAAVSGLFGGLSIAACARRKYHDHTTARHMHHAGPGPYVLMYAHDVAL